MLRVMLQLSRGANLAQKDINDMTALMWGAGEGHAEVTELLLKSGEKSAIK